VLALLALTVGMIALLLRVLRYMDVAVGPDEADPDAGGGGGGRAGRPPQPSDDGGEPAWWPEFERQLADLVARAGAIAAR
jgi:hypothetical protein